MSDSTLVKFRQVLLAAEKFIAPPIGTDAKLLQFVRSLRDGIAANEDLTPKVLLEAVRATDVREEGQEAGDLSEISRKYSALSLDDAIKLAQGEELTKKELLQLAQFRFQAQPGPLRRLRKDKLRDRIVDLAKNEAAHHSIARVASGSSMV